MPLPPDFFATIGAGARALLREETRLRKLACNGDPRLLLSVRDVSGLRGRLEDTERDDWELGRANWFAPQDFAVLEELAQKYGDLPYVDTPKDAEAFRRLRELLMRYESHDFTSSSTGDP